MTTCLDPLSACWVLLKGHRVSAIDVMRITQVLCCLRRVMRITQLWCCLVLLGVAWCCLVLRASYAKPITVSGRSMRIARTLR